MKFSDPEEFPLKSLSNLAIFARQNDDKIYPYLFCADGSTHIMRHLEKISSIRELYYVTFYFDSLYVLITRELMTAHKAKAKQLLPVIKPKDCLEELLTVGNEHIFFI